LGKDPFQILTAMSLLQPVEGRFHAVSGKGITAIVDYAHTPDALKNVLSTIEDLNEGRGRIITVVGCGGDRDKGKRPIMAQIATEYSHKAVLTSDNPRSEDPNAILDDMKRELDPTLIAKSLTITDRREAIKSAVFIAEPGDVILIAGKGHEKYQEIQGVKTPFDDIQEITLLLNS
jgi:UDP-N-acetylmuramoyl-L-alanyl-D-glutamate--2,6-diaminopimelate ligase